MMHHDDDNDDDELMIHSYDDDKKMRVRSMIIIDNHVTVMEIVIINSCHKLVVMAVAVIKIGSHGANDHGSGGHKICYRSTI